MKKFVMILLLFLTIDLMAQPLMTWQHCTGGTLEEYALQIVRTHDGGYVVIGFAESFDGDITSNQGETDVLVVRLDSGNNVQWLKTYGGSSEEAGSGILETADHGFVFVAGTESNDGDVSVNNGDNDIWVVRIDSVGNILWEKSFGDSTYDEGMGIIQNSAGNFMVVGWISNNWDADYCLLQLDPNGNLIWQQTYGGTDIDWAYQVVQTLDGGYMIGGWSMSTDGDVTGNHGEEDAWLVKTDASGNLQWQRSYGGSEVDFLTNVLQLPDGSYIFASAASSSDGDVQNNNTFSTQFWIVKVNSTGSIISQKCFGGSDWDEPYRMIHTADNGFAITGMTYSNDSDVTGNHGDMDCWTLKLDSNLNKQWAVCSGGSDEDLSYGICQLNNDDIVVTGYTYSDDGNVSGNHGGGWADMWTFRLSQNTSAIAEVEFMRDAEIYPNPSSGNFYVDFNSAIAGNGNIEVRDLSGRLLHNESFKAASGKSHYNLKLEELERGSYILTLSINGTRHSKKIVKL